MSQYSRGLRQGDPISPYIFILCMEYLSTLINLKCEEGSWKKIKASRSGPGFSHIFFANDLLLFAKTDKRNVEAVVEVLDEFCKLSGLKISKEKSKIFFSPNWDWWNSQPQKIPWLPDNPQGKETQ